MSKKSLHNAMRTRRIIVETKVSHANSSSKGPITQEERDYLKYYSLELWNKMSKSIPRVAPRDPFVYQPKSFIRTEKGNYLPNPASKYFDKRTGTILSASIFDNGRLEKC